jgi:outer membrane receptor protein involved in Fe transport
MYKSIHSMLVIFLLLAVPFIILAADGKIAGKITDSKTGEVLPGTNISIEGTSIGTAADRDGNFIMTNVPPGTYNLRVSFIGYEPLAESVTVTVDRTTTVNFDLKSTIIVGRGIVVEANRAIERETPVAFSDVKADKISKQFTVQDVPNMIKHVPGVYVTSDGGSGMGDTNMLIRGFDMQRVQVMINNIPVNDPESKKVYWSNWGSLPSASQSIQVQRGVGSSQYGSGAFGGSVNVVTSEAPAVSSLRVNLTGGQYSTYKAGLDYNTGLMNGRHSFLARFNYLTGNGFRRDTHYKGLQYYLAFTSFLNDNQTLRLILHGAPQMHAYTYYSMPMKNFVKYGRDFNAHPFVKNGDSGLTARETDGTTLSDVLLMKLDSHKGGEIIGNGYTSFDNNVYHKPQFEAHHNWAFSPETRVQTTAFFSLGRGYGENVNAYYLIDRNAEGMNTMQTITDANTYQYRAHSIHNQMGLLSNISTKWNDHDLSAGFEGRYWWARHYGTITNTFGQESIGYRIGNVKGQFREGDVYYDYYGTKPQITGFVHALWNFGSLSIMTDAQYSYRHYRIYEDLPSSNNRPSDNGTFIVKQNLEGGNNDGFVNIPDVKYNLLDFTKNYNFLAPKLGANYNISEVLNIFANYSRAYNEPRVKYFYNYGQPSDALPIETSDDIEVGFGVRMDRFNIKINGYNIDFSNKAYRVKDPTKANEPGYDYKGRRYVEVGDALYRGVEVAGSATITNNLELGLSLSKMKNAWGADITKDAQEQLGIVEGKIEPGMPQFILNGMVDYSIGSLWISGTMSVFQDYYILPDNEKVEVDGKMVSSEFVATEESPTLPTWKLLNVIIGYNLPFAGYNAALSLHLNNLLDEDYLQIGNEYGVIPGAERNIQMNLSLGF